MIRSLRRIVASLCLITATQSSASDEDVNYFKSNYPIHLEQLESRYSRIKGTAKLTRTPRPNSKTHIVDTGSFAIDHGFQKVDLRLDVKSNLEHMSPNSIFCVGNGRDFPLAKRPGSKRYEVQGIGTDDRVNSVYFHKFGRFVAAPFMVYGFPLSRTLSSASFRVVEAEKIEVDRRSLLRVSYQVGPLEAPDRTTILLDPAAGWVLRGGEIRVGRFPENGPIRFKLDYAEGPGGIPTPRLVRFDEPDGTVATCEFTGVSWEPTPKEEFSMAYYGLPDITGPKSTPGNRQLFLLVGLAAMGFAISWILRRLLKVLPPGKASL